MNEQSVGHVKATFSLIGLSIVVTVISVLIVSFVMPGTPWYETIISVVVVAMLVGTPCYLICVRGTDDHYTSFQLLLFLMVVLAAAAMTQTKLGAFLRQFSAFIFP